MVVNNQVGFTTLPGEARSSWHASDLAKAVNAPIWHANAGEHRAACSCLLMLLAVQGDAAACFCTPAPSWIDL